ncbi:hypothetical protein MRB53_032609 [Persea americana]|uniref:Uncharacterized protein n=1 Tax=Persea americana TaxID=3435 RepID=A0ACC2KSB1_PERAE|nr:hypothetical protein MRB53_032609 [Persea americana]
MSCSEVLPTEPELLHLRQLSPQIPYVTLEDGNYHLLYCSFEKPCLFCDDKYSTPDPVYCYGVMMGGIRGGKPGTILPNYKVSCDDQQEHHNKKKLLPWEFSCIQEDASHDHQDNLLSCSQENQSLVYDHEGSSCPPPLVLGKAPSSVADN